MVKKMLLLLCVIFSNVAAFENTKYVDIREYPYHVSIEKHGNHACSGALMHESWILTVASCVFRTDPSAVTVRVRTSTLSNGGDELKVSSVVVHENFDKFVLLNDIALIKLKIPVQFGEKLLPIGVPENEENELDYGTMCFVTGWKQTLPGPAEARFSVTSVPLVNRSICISKMPSYQPVLHSMLCAGNMTPGVETCQVIPRPRRRDATRRGASFCALVTTLLEPYALPDRFSVSYNCFRNNTNLDSQKLDVYACTWQGDPGAPLMEGQTLIGVLSYGLGCKTMIHPGVYTRVGSYLTWISTNTGIRYT